MLSLGVFGAIAVHVNCAFLVLTAKLVTRGVLFERYLIVWQTGMLAHDMMYSGLLLKPDWMRPELPIAWPVLLVCLSTNDPTQEWFCQF
jgi:hypothetical protein